MHLDVATIITLGNVILFTAFPAVVLFAAFYAARSPWRKLFVGRSMMYLALSLAAVLGLGLLRLVLGKDVLWLELVRVGSYVFVSVTLWRMFITLLRIQGQVPVSTPLANTLVLVETADQESDVSSDGSDAR